ncbi:MAG: cysteine desulfurase family protein [Pirellulales bacterium]
MLDLYLDHCSTSPLDPAVASEMSAAWLAPWGNPASPHRRGQAARQALETAREAIARRLGADIAAVGGERLVFTSGGTESNNLALLGLAGPPPGEILVSPVEHPSVLAATAELARRGFTVHPLPVDDQGRVILDQLSARLSPAVRLVSVQWGNHETGVIQPLAEVVQQCAAVGVPVHCDAVQAVGKVPVDFRQLGLAALTFTAHKIHGPVGIGGLLLRPGLAPTPLCWGGTQQLGTRPGTEPVVLAVGFARALELAQPELELPQSPLAERRDQLEHELAAQVPDIVISGAAARRLPHVSNVAFLGLDRQTLLLALDRAGVACSSGPACQSGAAEPSPVLRALGAPPAVIAGALRFSVGRFTSPADISLAVERISSVVNTLRSRFRTGNYASPTRHPTARPL